MAESADSKTGLAGVAAAAKQAPGRGLPPVHLWHPAHCGEIDILIRRDGLWMHEGSPIGRAELVRLFSTVLRKDDNGYVLVTPGEKLSIRVEDLPFRAVSVARRGDVLVFTTDVGDEAGAGRSIRSASIPTRRRESRRRRCMFGRTFGRGSHGRSFMNWSRWRAWRTGG